MKKVADVRLGDFVQVSRHLWACRKTIHNGVAVVIVLPSNWSSPSIPTLNKNSTGLILEESMGSSDHALVLIDNVLYSISKDNLRVIQRCPTDEQSQDIEHAH